jgi:hypothetical protein
MNKRYSVGQRGERKTRKGEEASDSEDDEEEEDPTLIAWELEWRKKKGGAIIQA